MNQKPQIIPINISIPINPFRLELILSDYEEEVKQMTCPVCITLVWNPVHCSLCTNLICKNCIESWLKKSNKCPLCNEVFKANNLVNLVKNTLSKIKSKCYYSQTAANNSDGSLTCNKVIPYYEFEEHIKSKCDHYPYKCNISPKCETVGPKIKMFEHPKFCEYNLLSCKYCKEMFSARLLVMHENQCDQKTIQCPTCSAAIKEINYSKHTKDVKECINYLREQHSNNLKIKDEEIANFKSQSIIINNQNIADIRNENIQLLNKTSLFEGKLGKSFR